MNLDAYKMTKGQSDWHEVINNALDAIGEDATAKDTAVSTLDASTVKRAIVEWGTSLSAEINNIAIVLANKLLYTVWFASTTDIIVKNIGDNTDASGSGTVKLDDCTFSRSDSTLTVTFPTAHAIKIIS